MALASPDAGRRVEAPLRLQSTGPMPAWPLQVGVVLACAVAIALLVVLGGWAAAVPAYLALFACAIAWPRQTTLAIAAILVAFEPGTFDFTSAISRAIYLGPPGMETAFPLTIAPVEVALAFAVGSVIVRGLDRERFRATPVLLAAIPVLVLAGLAYGFYRGAPTNFAYHESRGFIFGICAFVLAPTLHAETRTWLLRLGFGAAGFLAFTVIARYVLYVRWGVLPTSPEFAFAHDSVIYMMLAAVLAGVVALRQTGGKRTGLLLFALLMFVAIMMTGRRSGTLVAIVGVGATLFMLFPQRRALVLTVGTILLVVFAAYLGAFWNKEYGTLAQPARAIRSQIDPSARDESSDTYREIERYDLNQTIRSNPVFGVGFGNEFYRFQSLPDLRSFWPLQFHTPHQNVLWLWLKLGFVGISTVLAVFALALSRCVRAAWTLPPHSPDAIVAIAVAAGLLMYVSFATVDVVFPGTRPMVILGILLAIAFQVGRPAGSGSRSKKA